MALHDDLPRMGCVRIAPLEMAAEGVRVDTRDDVGGSPVLRIIRDAWPWNGRSWAEGDRGRH